MSLILISSLTSSFAIRHEHFLKESGDTTHSEKTVGISRYLACNLGRKISNQKSRDRQYTRLAIPSDTLDKERDDFREKRLWQTLQIYVGALRASHYVSRRLLSMKNREDLLFR